MSEPRSYLEIDTDAEIQKIMQMFKTLPDQIAAPTILKNALNATARKVRKKIVKDAQGRYALKDPGILRQAQKGAPEVVDASTSTMAATVRSKGPMQDIMAFMTKPNTGTGAAAAQVLKSGTMKPLEAGGLKAFVTTFSNGHVAIVQRNPPGQYSIGKGTRSARYGDGIDMTKIKKLLSPAVPHLLGNEEIRAAAEEMAYTTLQAELQKRIAKVLEKSA